MKACTLSAEPLVLEPLIASVRDERCGAIVTFLGVTRATTGGEADARRVEALEYEAYSAMAIPEMELIIEEISRRFPGVRVAMTHRTGRVPVSEPSVAIAVASPHRALAFDACEFAIDELKKRVPIWKNERYSGGESAWRENAGANPGVHE